MNAPSTPPRLLCLAIAAAFPVTAMADEALDVLLHPESQVTLGIGAVHGDNQRFGMYNGLAEGSTYFLGDVSLLRKNEDGATWLRFEARNLGLPSRELRFEQEKQGDGGYAVEYSEFRRTAPYGIHTNLQGIGSDHLTVINSSGRSSASATEIGTDRQKLSLTFAKFLNPRTEFFLKFQNEEKKGERLFGRGTPSVQEFLAEPIDSTTQQLDVTLSYFGEKIQLTGGYYGSFYNNHVPGLTVTGGASNLASFTPIALPPDNQAHQLYFTGGYDISRTTRATFKYSMTKATQTDAFILAPRCISPIPAASNPPTNDSCRSDLGGRVDLTLFQAGITSRPLKGFSLLANVRYEDRADKTVVAQYIQATSNASTNGYNEPRSLTTLSGKAEAAYQLGAYRLAAGLDYENKKRTMAGVRIVGYRAETDETSLRLEVKRSLADSLSGVIGYVVSNRNGADYRTLVNSSGGPYNAGGWLQPVYIADRDRQKLKLMADWSPTDALSVQFLIEDARDRYTDRNVTPQDVGLRSGDAQLYSVDVSYALSERWQLTGYASSFTTRIEQATYNNANLGQYWSAALKSAATHYGFGIKGRLARWDLAADLIWAGDHNRYALAGAASPLPDIDWKQTTFKLAAGYAYDVNTRLRFEYVHDRRKTNDWTWASYTYSDGTWLEQKPLEKVHFLGFALDYRFR